MVQPKDMDFVSGIAEIEAECYDEPPPRNALEAFWAWLVSYTLLSRGTGTVTDSGDPLDVIPRLLCHIHLYAQHGLQNDTTVCV